MHARETYTGTGPAVFTPIKLSISTYKKNYSHQIRCVHYFVHRLERVSPPKSLILFSYMCTSGMSMRDVTGQLSSVYFSLVSEIR